MQSNGQGDWISLAEAAKYLECSVDTVRRRLKRGAIEGRKLHTQTGYRWEVRLGALPKHAQLSKQDAAQADAQADPGALVEDQTRRQLEMLRDTLVMPLIHQNQQLHREVGELRERAGRLEAERDAAMRERDELRMHLDARESPEARENPSQDSHAGYVYREPEAPRRPWWRFWG
jgi:excisionase family DNA binding protein